MHLFNKSDCTRVNSKFCFTHTTGINISTVLYLMDYVLIILKNSLRKVSFVYTLSDGIKSVAEIILAMFNARVKQ